MKMWVKEIKRKIDDKKEVIKYGSLLTSFYMSTTCLQKIFGIMKIHSGRANMVLHSIGFCALASSVILSDIISNFVGLCMYPETTLGFSKNNVSLQGNVFNSLESLKNYHRSENNMKYLYLSTLSFIVLEQLPIPFVSVFHTLLPSSILTYGVFARGGLFGTYIGAGSIPSTAVAATDSERRQIQSVGRWRGCHHCGSRIRQLVTPKGVRILGGMGYISDHMPPTKVAKAMSEVWWRKLLKIQIKQRLYPQCKPCFQLQGEAVRRHVHTVVYHYGLRPCHFAPLVALYLCDNYKSNIDDVETEIHRYFTTLKEKLKNMIW